MRRPLDRPLPQIPGRAQIAPVNPIPARVLFVFVDGIGIGPDDPATNAFARARMPRLAALLDGALPLREHLGARHRITAERATMVAADATLGVPGRPQSGTGQTSLLTGRNAARMFGRHFGSWVPTALRPMLAERNLLSRAVRAGRRAVFANAHPPGLSLERRPNAPALAAAAAGLLTRGPAELGAGDAVASSITNERWIAHLGADAVPTITAAEAGRSLARIASGADLTFFAHYDTDYVGHRGSVAEAVAVLERLDAFLDGILAALPADTLLLVASDHGNLEDAGTGHTTNPVPVIAAGPGHGAFADGVRAITDLAPLLCELLQLEPDSED
jgi:2,3-bisphosphoglycerate-independent phosphoglycerate mutase